MQEAEGCLTVHIQTSGLTRILSGGFAADCHPCTASLFISTSAPTFFLPVFNRPFFIFQKIPFSFSINFPHFITSSFCPPPFKAIILLPFFFLYLHDTEVLSEAGQDGKRQAFTKRLRFNMFSFAFHLSLRASQQN